MASHYLKTSERKVSNMIEGWKTMNMVIFNSICADDTQSDL